MLRKIVDYKKLDHTVAAKLIESYPHGYGDGDLIVFKNSKGEFVEAVEVKTEKIIYLVRISKSLSSFIANFDEIIEKELEPTDLETSVSNFSIDTEAAEN
ncbi:hypothetical protein M4I21_01170 [Cellulophaga sp. 20_2_10]|uniref:hypothetical protein n=1 Tax=Cellulophaga sp. 20_2_10 TaxID=2942476 RepID=UPI00201A567C|nr:hypothetical protein [Cellulophaga sp. 20_2_10]MCL5244398.1 hypothetical protein [Cellulophaga sp. 20_2_10]